MKFHRGRDVVDLPPEAPLEGLEFSPKVRTALLGSGAMLYVSFIGLFIVFHYQHYARTHGDERIEYFTGGDPHTTIISQESVGAIRVAGKVTVSSRLREALTDSDKAG